MSETSTSHTKADQSKHGEHREFTVHYFEDISGCQRVEKEDSAAPWPIMGTLNQNVSVVA
jgi:hypothetical protein